jgi:hypothetical protein
MKYIIGAVVMAGALSACAANPTVGNALASPQGRLFCSIQMAGGGSFVAGVVAASVTASAPSAAPLVVIAANAGKAAVDQDCAKAAVSVAGAVSGAPVSPPVNPASAAQVAIVAPASPVVAVR